MTSPVTRRAAIVGALASATAVGIVGARAANGPKIGEIEPAPLDLQQWLDTASPDQAINYYLEQLTVLVRDQHGGGGWKGFYDRKSGVALVVRDERVEHAYLQIGFMGGDHG